MVITRGRRSNVSDNIIMNTKKPPFDNLKVRLAVSYAIDRRGLHPGACTRAAAVAGRLAWRRSRTACGACSRRTCSRCPGYGKPADEKAQARKLLAEAGFTPQNPLRVEMVTRAIADLRRHGVASWSAS